MSNEEIDLKKKYSDSDGITERDLIAFSIIKNHAPISIDALHKKLRRLNVYRHQKDLKGCLERLIRRGLISVESWIVRVL